VRTTSYVDEDANTSAPLTFDPNAPTPVPTVVVTPSSGLADRQIVSVHGEGFFPGDGVVVTQCESGGSLFDSGCSDSGYRYVVADQSGNVDVSVRVHQTITYYEYSASGIEEKDCAASPGECVLHVESEIDPNAIVETPLEFDTEAPPAPQPEMTIKPGRVLSDGQQITIDASGFLPDTQLAAVQCAGPVGEGSGTTCGAFTGSLYVNSDAEGEVHLTTTVHQIFQPALGAAPIDCGFVPDNCRLALAELQGSTSADATAMVSITFVPPVAVGGEIVSVGASDAPALAFTGSGSAQPIALVGTGAVGVGLLMLLLASRRRTRRPL
jgi:Neocarzinostatin family